MRCIRTDTRGKVSDKDLNHLAHEIINISFGVKYYVNGRLSRNPDRNYMTIYHHAFQYKPLPTVGEIYCSLKLPIKRLNRIIEQTIPECENAEDVSDSLPFLQCELTGIRPILQVIDKKVVTKSVVRWSIVSEDTIRYKYVFPHDDGGHQVFQIYLDAEHLDEIPADYDSWELPPLPHGNIYYNRKVYQKIEGAIEGTNANAELATYVQYMRERGVKINCMTSYGLEEQKVELASDDMLEAVKPRIWRGDAYSKPADMQNWTECHSCDMPLYGQYYAVSDDKKVATPICKHCMHYLTFDRHFMYVYIKKSGRTFKDILKNLKIHPVFAKIISAGVGIDVGMEVVHLTDKNRNMHGYRNTIFFD